MEMMSTRWLEWRSFAWWVGLLIVVIAVPGWVQPAQEAKSAWLTAAGAAGWAVVGLRGRTRAWIPWALLLPVGFLAISVSWAAGAPLGLQRLQWFMAALGITLAAGVELPRLFLGIEVGATLHALVILFEGLTGRGIWGEIGPSGFFVNGNMAAFPLLFCLARRLWLGYENPQGLGYQYLVPGLWLLALSLTQSRLQTGVACAALGAWSFAWALKEEGEGRIRAAGLALLTFGALAGVHAFGWILIPAGIAAGWWGMRRQVFGLRPTRPLTAVFLVFGLASGAMWSTAGRHHTGGKLALAGAPDKNWEVRKHYYQIALHGWMSAPLQGTGLGSARAEAPRFSDKSLPPVTSGFGDFMRPNTLHSDWLELLMEGGLAFMVLLGAGWFLDRRQNRDSGWGMGRWIVGLPCLAVGLLDFPFHKPFGILVGTVMLAGTSMVRRCRAWERIAALALAGTLLIAALGGIWAASRRPRVESLFRTGQHSQEAYEAANRILTVAPWDPELRDLRDKALIQWSVAKEAKVPMEILASRLGEALAGDPWDHHLLLRSMQVAKSRGQVAEVADYSARYAEAAPADPDRYLRLARDARAAGRLDAVRILVDQAQRQPGFTAEHRKRAELLKMSSSP